MFSPASSSFFADKPISKAPEDALDRRSFAYAVADRLVAWPHSENLIAAIFGDWGSGKSSVKNLLVEYIEAKKAANRELRIQITQFEPWQFSGTDQLTNYFFNSLAESIADLPVVSKSKSAKRKKLSARRMRKYGMMVGAGASALSVLSSSPSLGLAALGGFGAAANISDAVGKLLCKAGEALEEPRSLEELKTDLKNDFDKLAFKHIVVVDDVDRLTPEEICLLFRIIKANSDFPNVIFLILAQRRAVTKALDGITHDEGGAFLEKIVQIPFDLPAPSLNQIAEFWLIKVDSILLPLHSGQVWDKDRLVPYWRQSLRFYFKNLRDCYRFLNALSFTAAIFQGSMAFEVNDVDLIVVEAIRVFEPRVYELISASKSILIGEMWFNPDRSEEVSAAKLLLDKIAALSNHEVATRAAITSLFPVVDQLSRGHTSYAWYEERLWKREKRVCDPLCFERYFRLLVPPNQVPESEIAELTVSGTDANHMGTMLASWDSRGLLKNALERLEAEEDLGHLVDPCAFIKALTSVIDERPPSNEFFSDDPDSSPGRFARSFLRNERDLETRNILSMDLAKAARGLAAALKMVWHLTPLSPADHDVSDLIDESTSTELRRFLACRIDDEKDDFVNNPRFPEIIGGWRSLDKEAADDWLRSKGADKSCTLKILSAFIIRTFPGDKGVDFSDRISLEAMLKVAPLAEWIRWTDESRLTALDSEGAEALALFDEAVKKSAQPAAGG